MRIFHWLLLGVIAALLIVPTSAIAARGSDDHVSARNVIPHVITFDAHNGKDHPGGGPPEVPEDEEDPTPADERFVLLPGPRASSSVSYVVEDPGIDGAVDAVNAGFAVWEAASGIDFTFTGTAAVNANTEVSGPNGNNTVSWALFTGNSRGTLAVTILWIDDVNGNGVWDDDEQILESDLLFNSKNTWAISEDGPRGKWFDIQAISAHEAGHFVGLDDQNDWNEQTMFASASVKETKKRDLEAGDIAGAQLLFGLP